LPRTGNIISSYEGPTRFPGRASMKKNDESAVAGFLERIEDIYALPPVVARFNRLLNDPETTAQDVADAVSADVVMAAKVLKLVNSSFFGFSRRIGSLKTAIVILGFNEIRKLVLTLGTFQAISKGRAGFPYAAFWLHSVAVGFFTEAILAERDPKEKDDAFVAGLLHDVGKLILAQELPDSFDEIRKRAENGTPWTEAEREVLGFDHCELGGALGGAWRFPGLIVEAIRSHHSALREGEAVTFVSAVRLSDLLVRSEFCDLPGGRAFPDVEEELWEVLDLDGDRVQPLFSHLERAGAFVGELLGKVAPDSGEGA